MSIVQLELDNADSMIRAIQANRGIGIVPEAAVRRETADGSLRVVACRELRMTRPLGIIFRRSGILHQAASEFGSLLLGRSLTSEKRNQSGKQEACRGNQYDATETAARCRHVSNQMARPNQRTRSSPRQRPADRSFVEACLLPSNARPTTRCIGSRLQMIRIRQASQIKLRDESMKEKLLHLPPKQGLYDPALEKDSCGVGFIAHIKGQRVTRTFWMPIRFCKRWIIAAHAVANRTPVTDRAFYADCLTSS